MNANTRIGSSGQGTLPKTPQCQGAVVRAYDNLRTAGVNDQQAFVAAARLYRTHHPEADVKSARLHVASWIYDR